MGTVTPLHKLRCCICSFETRDPAEFPDHMCHPVLRAQGPMGFPATPTTDRPRSPLRLVGTPPAGSPVE
jgi:hypothetical protein